MSDVLSVLFWVFVCWLVIQDWGSGWPGGYVEVYGPGRYDYSRIPYPGLTGAGREAYTTQGGDK